jgi:hypothetical protein
MHQTLVRPALLIARDDFNGRTIAERRPRPLRCALARLNISLTVRSPGRTMPIAWSVLMVNVLPLQRDQSKVLVWIVTVACPS